MSHFFFMPSTPFIPVILGTARKQRRSENVAEYVYTIVQCFPCRTKLIDVADFVTCPRTIPPWEKESKKIMSPWQKVAKKADGFIIVTPEYNHGYPGELKLLLDMAFQEYEKKPVALVGVSEGGFGGVRVIEHLQPILTNFKMIPVPKPISILHVDTLFEQPKAEIDRQYKDRIERLVQSVLDYATLIKQ